jgi:hypothetical protein
LTPPRRNARKPHTHCKCSALATTKVNDRISILLLVS